MQYLLSNLKYLLQKQNKKEEDLYQYAGMGQENIIGFITDGFNPSPDQLVKMADFFNTSLDVLIRKNLSEIAIKSNGNLKMLVMDVDGVLSDGGMYYSDSGIEIKKYNAKDGLAMMRLSKAGFEVGMISHGFNRALVKQRGEMLGIKRIYTGSKKKLEVLSQWSEESGIPLEAIAYIGDDLNDLDVMEAVGLSACPSDAAVKVRQTVDYVLTTPGGRGCVREFAEDFLSEYLQ